jgi:hypothetical protein
VTSGEQWLARAEETADLAESTRFLLIAATHLQVARMITKMAEFEQFRLSRGDMKATSAAMTEMLCRVLPGDPEFP